MPLPFPFDEDFFWEGGAAEAVPVLRAALRAFEEVADAGKNPSDMVEELCS